MIDLVKLPPSDHFHLVQLAHGVYSAVARVGGAAFSNERLMRSKGPQELNWDLENALSQLTV